MTKRYDIKPVVPLVDLSNSDLKKEAVAKANETIRTVIGNAMRADREKHPEDYPPEVSAALDALADTATYAAPDEDVTDEKPKTTRRTKKKER